MSIVAAEVLSIKTPLPRRRSTAGVSLFVASLAIVSSCSVSLFVSHAYGQDADMTFEQLAEAMSSAELDVRRDAAYELAGRGESSLAAIDALIGGLKDRDDQVWMQSTMAIARIGIAASDAIGPLIENFDQRSEQRRYRAAWAVSRLGPRAVPAVIEAARNDSATIRATAVESMGWMRTSAEQVVPALAEGLEDQDPNVRSQAILALSKVLPESLPVMVEALGHQDREVRRNAAHGVSKFAPLPSAAKQPLMKMLQEGEPSVRAAAMTAIAGVSLSDQERESIFRDAIVDPDLEVRGAAIMALKRSESDPSELIAMLLPLLESDDVRVRSSAAVAIGSFGGKATSAVRPLIRSLIQSSSSLDELTAEQLEMISAISRIGPAAVPELLRASSEAPQRSKPLDVALARLGPGATSALINALGNDSAWVASSAARALSEMDPIPESAIGPLAELLEHPSSSLRKSALDGLGKCDGLDPGIVRAFRSHVQDKDASVRASAVLAIALRDENSTEVSDLLRDGLRDSDAVVRTNALEGIAEQGIANEMMDELATALSDDDPGVRLASLKTLTTVGTPAHRLSGQVASLLADPDNRVRVAAAAALGDLEVSDKETITQLSKCLQDDNRAVVLATLNSLAALGDASKPHVSEVLPLLNHPASEVRSAALVCVSELDDEAAIPVLIDALEDQQWTVRRDASEALGKFGSKAKSAVPVLFRFLASEEDRDAARSALRAIDDAGPEAVPVLVEALDSDDRGQRYYAMFLLGKVGKDARDALPVLRRLLEDTDSDRFRGSIRQTIERIEGD